MKNLAENDYMRIKYLVELFLLQKERGKDLQPRAVMKELKFQFLSRNVCLYVDMNLKS